MILLEHLQKNQAYRYFFVLDVSDVPLTIAAFSISALVKDVASPTNLTNAPVAVGDGKWYVDLTADEMNADSIMVLLKTSSYTTITGSTGSIAWHSSLLLTKQAAIDLSQPFPDITEVSDANPSIGEVLSLMWQIIRKGGNRGSSNLKKILKNFDF